jgi:hypothetical protein
VLSFHENVCTDRCLETGVCLSAYCCIHFPFRGLCPATGIYSTKYRIIKTYHEYGIARKFPGIAIKCLPKYARVPSPFIMKKLLNFTFIWKKEDSNLCSYFRICLQYDKTDIIDILWHINPLLGYATEVTQPAFKHQPVNKTSAQTRWCHATILECHLWYGCYATCRDDVTQHQE